MRTDNVTQEKVNRIIHLAEDEQLRNHKFELINQEVGNLEQDQKKYNDLLNKKIHNIFDSAFLNRIDSIKEKCTEAQELVKRRMFLRLKNFLIRERCLTTTRKDLRRLDQQIDALPFKVPHLQEKWD